MNTVLQSALITTISLIELEDKKLFELSRIVDKYIISGN